MGMRIRSLAAALAFAASAPLCVEGVAKEVASFDFEEQAQFDAWAAAAGKNGAELKPSKDVFHSGKQALLIKPNVMGGQSAPFQLPKDFKQGVISFWFNDALFAKTPQGTEGRPGWELSGPWTKNGKSAWGGFGFDNGRGRGFWTCDHGNDLRSDTAARRHDGWTKFDIVLEPEGPKRSAIVYVDGVEAWRTPAEGFVPSSFRFCTYWGAGDFYADDVKIDDDASSFHPGVAQAVNVASPAEGSPFKTFLKAGEPLKLDIAIDPKGASAKKGVLKVELYDLQEKLVAETEKKLDWSEFKGSKLSVELPPPPASKHYWVLASYRDDGAAVASSCLYERIDVQHLADPSVRSFRDKLVFTTPWEWLPSDKDGGSAVPSDWSVAKQVRDYWFNNWDRRLKEFKYGWYRRSVEIPASWNGRRVLLSVEQPSNVAKAFVNGEFAGELPWPGGELDVTSKLKAGAKAEIAIFVDAESKGSLGKAAEAALKTGAKLPDWYNGTARGLGGGAELLSEPMGAKLDSVAISPKVPAMTLDLEFSASGLSKGATCAVEGSVSLAGKVVKTFKSEPFKAESSSRTVSVSFQWPDAKLWDIGKPNLYDLDAKLLVDGKQADAMAPERFGFRQVVFDGRLVKINGNPVNFVTPMPVMTEGAFGVAKAMARVNDNYISSNHHHFYMKEGDEHLVNANDHFDLCDEAGFGGDIGVSDVVLRKFLTACAVAQGADFSADPVYWPAYEKVIKRAVARRGNRPGVLFYLGGGGGGQIEMGGMFNPAKMDGLWLKRFDDKPVMRQLFAVESKARDVIHRLDPRKPVIAQDGGNFNDAIHITHYAGFMPLQEFLESDSYWLKNGVKPYMITEQSAPWVTDWTSGARKGHNSPDRYTNVAERAAVTEGDAAFHRTDVDKADIYQFGVRCQENLKRDPKSRSGAQPPLGVLYAYQRDPQLPSFYSKINFERARAEWLNWRAEGIGLLCDWDTTMTGKVEAAKAAWAPVVGYIAGTPEQRTDKTHILRAGETWSRQFLVMSNKREPVSVKVEWTVSLDGKSLDSGSAKAKLAPGGQASIPIKIETPAKLKADASGELRVSLFEDGKELCSDKASFSVLPPASAPALSSRIAVIDPEGATAAALEKLGVKFQLLNFNSDLGGFDVVIFGRKAFNYEPSVLPGKPLDLGELASSGKKILVMEQAESVLRDRFGFRTEYASPRSMFGRVAGHPVTKGLPDELLNYWRGASTLTGGYEEAFSQNAESESNGARRFLTWNDGKEHPRQMKWGNSHNVATVVVEKPGRGNFRSLIDCEFNLDYAALLELEEGSGRLLFCQADVSGRTAADPAAERLLSNIVSYLDGAKPAAWSAGVAYLGGAKGSDLLERLKAKFRAISSPDELKQGEILFLGDALDGAKLASWKDSIAKFVKDGGVCVSFPRSEAELAWLPFEATLKDSQVEASHVDKPSNPLFAGLSNGDLYFSGYVALKTFDKLPQDAFVLDSRVIAEVPYGKGRYVLCQESPESFDLAKQYYLDSSMKHSYRVYQAFLENLGAPMTHPRFLDPRPASNSKEAREPLDLTKAVSWLGAKTSASDSSAPADNDARWKPVKVPGYVNDQRPEWDSRSSFVFWYRCKFSLGSLPPTKAPATLYIASIDDEDDVWFNGTLIGHTGRDTNTNDWIEAPRYYKIPMNLVKEGENEILIKVFNYQDKCGVVNAPVRISWGPAEEVKQADSQLALAFEPPLDISGWWYKLPLDSLSSDDAIPPNSDPRWSAHDKNKRFHLPGVTTELENSTVWFRSSDNVNVKAIPAGARPVLFIGAVDDEDTVFVNGVKIGHIGKDTNPKNYWDAPRVYPIPDGVLKTGYNTVVVKTNNIPPGGGSVTGPMQIFWMPPEEAAKLRLSISPYVFEVSRFDDPYWWCGGW